MKLNVLKFLISILMLSTLQSCPSDRDGLFQCNNSQFAIVPDLISLSPLKQSYSANETVILKMSVDSENNYSGTQFNIYENSAGQTSGFLYADFRNLLEGNEVQFLKGSKEPNIENYRLAYDAATKKYVLEILIKLKRIGIYKIHTAGTFHLNYNSKAGCSLVDINTDFVGDDADYNINFTVQ